ncbi:hypothetical protein B296_00000974 [Ensete ventricosum]|uniref:DEX1 C-terminal domain-containing protein n=1 Tax=Ensete ventricosum TaxID=4639 RepID=A0A427B102_ENSVE|nr:hypothetical protein B296_00000974 [Ensete ventricosum]
MDKLEVPRRRVRKNWYVGLHPDPVDRSHPDVHDDLLVEEASAMNSMSHVNGSMPETNTSISLDNSVNASKLEDEGKLDSIQSDQYNGSSINLNNNTKHDISMENVTTDNTTHIQRRLLEETDGKGAQDGHSETTTSAGATVENDQDLEEEADSSFDLFRDPEELADEYNYDYDDYVDESMWGDENWTEENHEKLEDYVSIDSHILCTPVMNRYYDNPQHLADLGGINIEKYVASGIVVFNLDTKQVKWTADLDLSVDSGNFRAYIYSSPTVVDLDGDGNMDILVGTSYGLFYILDHHGNFCLLLKIRSCQRLGTCSCIHRYTMVLADNVDGGDDLDLVVTTMNGNVFCFSTTSPHHPLKTTLLVPGNYQGERRIVVNQVYDRPGKQRLKLPTVPVRTTGTVIVEMVDKNGLYFSDEFSLTFHMYYYKLLKWLLVLPMLGMFGILVILGPQERAPLPSFSRNID